jgi:branched-subunit amino acid aminotransferase/4-amino-4-deoxychorismate lyase
VIAWRFADGVVQPAASLPLADRGFRYGMSFFETVAIFRGRPLFLFEHLRRLEQAAGPIGGIGVLASAISALPLPDGVLRLYVTAGPGTITDPFQGNIYLLAEPAAVGPAAGDYRLCSVAAPYTPRPGGWKTGNYWQNVDALTAARRAGCEEALLFNAAGALVSASMANVFLQIGGGWVTPALECGARDGVIREWAIRKTGATESVVDVSSLAEVTACFLTNSRIGIQHVTELDGRPLGDIGPIVATYREKILQA